MCRRIAPIATGFKKPTVHVTLINSTAPNILRAVVGRVVAMALTAQLGGDIAVTVRTNQIMFGATPMTIRIVKAASAGLSYSQTI